LIPEFKGGAVTFWRLYQLGYPRHVLAPGQDSNLHFTPSKLEVTEPVAPVIKGTSACKVHIALCDP